MMAYGEELYAFYWNAAGALITLHTQLFRAIEIAGVF